MCQTLNIMLINIIWQAEKCNLLWKESVNARNRIKCDRFQRSMTYPLRAVVSLFPFCDRIKEKKNVFRRQIELQQKESSARLEYSNMSACSWSAFEKRGDRTGWRARWNLHLRDARRMYSMCRRCQTVKRLWDKPGISMSIASYILHPNFSEDLVQRKSSFSTRLRLTVVTFSFVIFFLFLLILSR